MMGKTSGAIGPQKEDYNNLDGFVKSLFLLIFVISISLILSVTTAYKAAGRNI